MRYIDFTSRYTKSLNRCHKRGKKMQKLAAIIDMLQLDIPLPVHNKDHQLKGNYNGCRECHIEPDWLLIYRIDGEALILEDTGSHSDLFE